MASKRVVLLALVITTALLFIGCGPSTRTSVKWDWQPYNQSDLKQEKDGVVIESKDYKTLPEAFYVVAHNVAANCQAYEGATTKFPALGNGNVVYNISITNNTDHVLRMNGVVIKLFDPANNTFDLEDKSTLMQRNMSEYPCVSNELNKKLGIIKLYDRNSEILPNSTVTAWLVIKPTTFEIPGVWKLAIYEVPTKVDEAGKVIKTTRFEIRTNVKKIKETWQVEAFKEPVLLKSEEATD